MALLGTLSGFGITEIFQLISQQTKSGALILTAPKKQVSILFEDGILTGVTSSLWEHDPRADILLENGFLQDKILKTARAQEDKKGVKWHETLIAQGKLSENVLAKTGHMTIREVLLEIFQWSEGSYKFEETVPEIDNLLTCSIPAEGIILDTLRMIDEWPGIKAKMPPTDYCPVKVMPLTEEIVREYDLTPTDLNIYDIIDENKTVETHIKESLEMRFDAISAFVRLIDAGVIETFPQGAKQQIKRTILQRTAVKRIKAVAAYTLLIATVAVLTCLLKPQPLSYVTLAPEVSTARQSQLKLAADFAKRDIRLSTLTKDTHVH